MPRLPHLLALLLPVTVVACGDTTNKHTYNDAALTVDAPRPPDAAVVDAPPDAPPAGVVKVTVYDQNGVLSVGTPVAFMTAAGAVVSDTVTGADGVATATMGPGGTVTAVQPQINTPGHLYSFVDVKPGDQLVVGSATTILATVNVAFTLPMVAGATSFSVTSPCGGTSITAVQGGTTTGTLSVAQGCAKPGLLVAATDTAGIELGSIFKPALVANATIDLSAEALMPPRKETLTLTNVAAYLGTPSSYTQTLWPTGDTYDYHAGPMTVNGTSQTTDFQVSDTGASLMYTYVNLNRGNGYEEVDHIGPFAATSSYDLDAELIPWSETAPAFDSSTQTLRWTEIGTGAATFTLVSAQFNGASTIWWDIVAPWTAGTLTLPPLPPSFAAFAIDPTASVYVANHELVKVPAGGWDVARPLAFTGPDFSQLAALAPAAVSAAVTYSWSPNVGGLVRRRHHAAAPPRR